MSLKLIIIGVAAMVLIGLGGYFINKFADTNVKVGKVTCEKDQAVDIIDEKKLYEKQKIKNAQIPNADFLRAYCERVCFTTPLHQCMREAGFID
jgi:hypothetical protein